MGINGMNWAPLLNHLRERFAIDWHVARSLRRLRARESDGVLLQAARVLPLVLHAAHGPEHAVPVDEVIPRVPVRQWVLSFPIGLRIPFAARPELLTLVLRLIGSIQGRIVIHERCIMPKDRVIDRLSGRRYRRGSGKRWFENPIRP